MADSNVAVTAGAGTNIDTRTEGTNGHHRQVVVVGDPATNAGVAPVDATAGLKVDLGADNDVSVSGTVTANLSSTDYTVLDNIDADTTAIQTAVETIDDIVKTEDAAHQSGDKGVMALAVRQDSQSDFGADGDYVPLSVNDAGQLRVEASVEAEVDTTGLATEAKQDDIITAIEAIPGGGGTEYTEGATDATITGQAMLWEDSADTLRAVSAAKPLPVDLQDSTVAVTQSGTWDEVGINDSGNSITVDNAGTFATQVDGAALTALQLIDDVVGATGSAIPAKANLMGVSDGTNTRAARAISSTFNSSDLGIQAAGLVAQLDDTSPTSITENQFGVVRMTPERSLNVEIRDAAGNERGLNIDGSGNLTANINGTVTVGSHAVTNAGVFATQVDGSALTALQLIDDPVATLGTTTYSEATTKGMIIGAVRRDADTTLADTTNEITPLQVDAAGKLKVEVFDGGDSHTVDYATTGSGNATGALRVEIANNGTGLVGLNAGTNGIGKLTANSGVDIGDVDVTSISAGTNNIGNVGLIPRTSGGMSIFRSLDIDETEEDVKTSAGQVFSISAFNRTAAPLYLKFYNATAANVTVGSTTPVLTFVVPANADSDGAGFIWNNEIGFAFGTAISVAATTGIADADTGAPGANDCVINVGYA